MKIWTEADVETALSVIAAGNSIRSTALKYGMSECYLRKRIKKKKEGRQLVGSGRKPTLGVEQEKQLAKKENTTKKKINFGKRKTWKRKISESTTEDESSDDSIEEETEEEIIESEEEVSSVEKSDEERLKDLWESLSPPISESEVTQKWYGVVYEQQKKNYLYVGKALRRFLVDADGPVTSIQIECLKQHVGTEPILEWIPPHLPRDIYECPIYNIIEGPLVVAPLKGDKWHVPDYTNLKEILKKTVKLDRKKIAESLQ